LASEAPASLRPCASGASPCLFLLRQSGLNSRFPGRRPRQSDQHRRRRKWWSGWCWWRCDQIWYIRAQLRAGGAGDRHCALLSFALTAVEDLSGPRCMKQLCPAPCTSLVSPPEVFDTDSTEERGSRCTTGTNVWCNCGVIVGGAIRRLLYYCLTHELHVAMGS
jgi:hypothetical protein